LNTQTVRQFNVARCTGTVSVVVFDQDTLPVANYPVQLYTHLGAYAYASSGINGIASFGSITCGGYGVIAEPNAGFSVTYDRGLGFQDGLTVTNGGVVNTRLFVTRN
jgi:hypothetical protein